MTQPRLADSISHLQRLVPQSSSASRLIAGACGSANAADGAEKSKYPGNAQTSISAIAKPLRAPVTATFTTMPVVAASYSEPAFGLQSPRLGVWFVSAEDAGRT
jgi:hypothetical protein